MKFPIYLDYQATTPVDKRVVDAMLPYFLEKFGNSTSLSHQYGWVAEEAVDIARENIAHLINANPKEIIFTSGATESNNLALIGLARAHKDGNKKHIISFNTEHKSILEPLKYLEKEGFDITILPVGADGLIDLNLLKKSIRENTLFISVMAINNEIGVIQDLKQIGEIAKEKDIFFHCDAAQAFAKIEIDVEKLNISLLSISAHKCYGPKGVGALYIRRFPKVNLEPLFYGGGQEQGLRSGTIATPLCVGLGEVARLAAGEMTQERVKIEALGKMLYQKIKANNSSVILNGSEDRRYYGNLNLTFPNSKNLISKLKKLAISSGSACSTGSTEGSYVLNSLDIPKNLMDKSIRIGIGRFTTTEEVDFIVESFTKYAE